MDHDNVLVVLNYNDFKTTMEFIGHVKNCPAISKIVVVDNCSTDGSYDRLSSQASDRVDVIKSDRNGGYAYGNNFGLRYAVRNYHPKILFVSNPDVRFDNSVVLKMAQCLETNDDIAVVAPLVNQGYNVWDLPGYIGVIESLFLIWHNLHKKRIKQEILSSDQDLIKVGAVEGSFFAITAAAYEKTHGLDERTFLYFEENILAQRIKEINQNIAVLGKCRYDHFHSVSIKKAYRSKAKAFKLFYPSISLYLSEYLHINRFQKALFDIFFFMAYLERYVYMIFQVPIDRMRSKRAN